LSRLGLLSGDAEHSEQRMGEEGERDVAIPPLPTADFVVVEPDLLLGSLEGRFDRPAPSGDGDQFLQSRCRGGEADVGLPVLGITGVAPDKQLARPAVHERINQPQPLPVVDPWGAA